MSELLFMQRALELAGLGRGKVAPNPMVGCVVVHQGKIIGEGFHQKFGASHAEVNAIHSVNDKNLLKESTVYVSLEPCAHFGKTPPCADLLIDHQVKKVVIACRDPFEAVAGKGIEKLKNAGVEVETGLLEEEARSFNERFFTFHEKKRPYVVLKWAQTADGFIARSNFDSKWISNVYSRQLVHKWRAEEAAILVGKNTAIHDNPTLNVRDWVGSNPVRVLLDSSLEVPQGNHLFDDVASTLVINRKKNDQKKNVEWVMVEAMQPATILQVLHERGIQSLLIEGGSQTLHAFIAVGLWDEARVFQSETSFSGGITAPSIEGTISQETNVEKDQLTIYRNHG